MTEKGPTSGTVMAALVKRFHAPAWALLEQVADGTGHGISRYADAMAMSLWPSRGLDLHGIEVKVSRGDWLRELKRPAKAEPMGVYCDFWWLAVAPGVVNLEADAIPQTWGVLVLERRGLVQHRAAERNPMVEPPDKYLLAAILRRASERHVPKSAIAEVIEAARTEGYERGQAFSKSGNEAKEYAALKESVRAFEAASGVPISSYGGGDIGARFKAAQAFNMTARGWVLKQAHGSLVSATKQVEEAIAAVKAADAD